MFLFFLYQTEAIMLVDKKRWMPVFNFLLRSSVGRFKKTVRAFLAQADTLLDFIETQEGLFISDPTSRVAEYRVQRYLALSHNTIEISAKNFGSVGISFGPNDEEYPIVLDLIKRFRSLQ